MIEVKKQSGKQSAVAAIRSASRSELANYEKNKIINTRSREPKFEETVAAHDIVTAATPPTPQPTQPISATEREPDINLGTLAFKSTITPNELSSGELFFIKCELDESVTKECS